MRQYGVTLGNGSMLHYRDGRDSMGFHRDTDMRYLDDTIVAILNIGGPRPFALRPIRSIFEGDESQVRSVALGPGDLIVMGGRCQADWQHSVPKQYRLAVPGRISVQWRWTSGRGRPAVGPPSSAPRTYSA
jgi:alkylated DNA repair dioxygenase AlkB